MSDPYGLTRRQVQCMDLYVLRGLSSELAGELAGLKPKTVELYVLQAFRAMRTLHPDVPAQSLRVHWIKWRLTGNPDAPCYWLECHLASRI